MAPKPNLRNMAKKEWSVVLAVGLAASGGFALWFRTNVLEARKKHYKEFNETYDVEADYQRMKRAGVFKGYEA